MTETAPNALDDTVPLPIVATATPTVTLPVVPTVMPPVVPTATPPVVPTATPSVVPAGTQPLVPAATPAATLRLVGSEPVSTAPSAETSGKGTRLAGVDATRGVALLGMIGVHTLYENTGSGQPGWWFMIFGGRAAAAFAVLAGVGIAFMTGRQRVRLSTGLPTIAALGVRALLIGAIGLALGYGDASIAAVILPYYAVMFLLAIPVVFLPTWTVSVVGLVMATAMPALGLLVTPHLPEATLENPTVGNLLHDPGTLLAELSITGEYPALPWMAYVCAGLVVGRLALTRTRVAVGLLVTGTAFAVAAQIVSWYLLNRHGGLAHIWAAQPGSDLTIDETREIFSLGSDGTTPSSTWWWLAVAAPHTGTPPDLLGTTGTALALLGVALLAGKITRPVARLLITIVRAPLAAAGSMTLTFYTAHVMFLNSEYDVYDAVTGFVLQVIAVLLIGLAWRATVGRGPLESFVAALAGWARKRASRRPTASRRLTASWRPIGSWRPTAERLRVPQPRRSAPDENTVDVARVI